MKYKSQKKKVLPNEKGILQVWRKCVTAGNTVAQPNSKPIFDTMAYLIPLLD